MAIKEEFMKGFLGEKREYLKRFRREVGEHVGVPWREGVVQEVI